MRTAYFKSSAIRFDSIPSKAAFVVLVVPSIVFSAYRKNCRYKYSIQIAWLNWAVSYLWHEQVGEIWEHG